MIYGILYVSEVLGKIKPGMSKRDAEKARPCHRHHTNTYQHTLTTYRPS